jgi:hypothetical protein
MAFDYAAKIQALLANADNESLPDEARATYRAKAEELMIKYRVAEEEALATDPASSKPIHHVIKIADRRGVMQHWYTMVFQAIVNHTGCRMAPKWDQGQELMIVVGYEGDVRYTEFLWTAALLMFSTRIDPRWDDQLPEAENVWRLRNAGIERRIIADQAWGCGAGQEAKNRSKVQRIYLAQCRQRGEDPRVTGLGHQTDIYREAYARSFYRTLKDRLREARDAVDSFGGGVVLHGREERVDEAFYTLFPSRRPNPNQEPVQVTPCPRCTPEKACRKHAWNASDEREWQRRNNSPSALAGDVSGRHAAEGVIIQRGHRAPTRVDSGSRQEIQN